MDLATNLKWKWEFFKDNWSFLKTINSPFKPLKLYWYFGDITKGVPYFYPRKTIKSKTKPGYLEFVDIKYFGITWCWLGYKTKWTDTDYRHEWNPALSFILFGRQLYFELQPVSHNYWECWLIYQNHTNKKLSKKDRLLETMEIYPCIWYKGEEPINYYKIILKDKYLKHIKN